MPSSISFAIKRGISISITDSNKTKIGVSIVGFLYSPTYFINFLIIYPQYLLLYEVSTP